MKSMINKGFYRFKILKCHDCDPDEPTLEFHNTTSAFSFLSMFISDPFNMMIFRDVLAESSLCADLYRLYRLTDHDVCQRLACQIANGYIKLIPEVDKIPYALLGGEPKETEAFEAPVPETAAGKTVALPISEEISEQLSETELEIQGPALVPFGAAAVQATTMMLAAESGVPFCDT
jgi:hypothetical protein